MSLSGNLRTVSFPDILQLLSGGRKTGVLEIRTATRQKEVSFREGNIIYATSLNSSEDLLGNMLLSKGKLSKTDLERAITLHKQTGRQLGTTLIDMNIFDKEEIAECLKLQIEEIVYNLFSWHEGDFLFHEGAQPKHAPFYIELPTMSVIMEGTRRIDEWLVIQKVLPPDDVLLAVAKNPKRSPEEEIVLTLEEFRLLSLINGERTLPDLMLVSPVGEFVTCRALYKLVVSNLVEVAGRRDVTAEAQVDEEEAFLRIVFGLYNNCFFRLREVTERLLGENTRYTSFVAQYRSGLTAFFPGGEPGSQLAPSFDKFAAAVKAIPPQLRYYRLMSSLESMLSEQLEYVFQLVGVGAYRDAVVAVKKEIAEPLSTQRDLVKRFGVEDSLYKVIKKSDRVIKMARG